MENPLEFRLISDHRSIEKQISDAKLNVYYSDPNEKPSKERELSHLLEIKERIETALGIVKQTPLTEIKRRNVTEIIEALLLKLKRNRFGHPLSGDQGTINANAIYGYVIYDIRSGFDSDDSSYQISNYYYEVDGHFDHTQLKQQLENALSDLKQNLIADYLTLKQFVETLGSRLRELAQER